MPAKFLKDFNKDTKDLLTKQYLAPGSWKMESKIKPDDRTLMINPGFETAKGGNRLSVDLDYNVKEYALKTKTTLSADGNIKPKVTWEKGPSKVEFTLKSLAVESDFELVYEGTYPTNISVYDKMTRNNLDASVSYANGPFTVGASAAIAFPSTLKGWSCGARAAINGYIVNVTTNSLKTYTTGVYAPLKISGRAVAVAAQVDCGHNQFDVVVGAETTVEGVTVKAKINKAANLTVALVRKFNDKWTAALTLQLDTLPKFGLNLTRE